MSPEALCTFQPRDGEHKPLWTDNFPCGSGGLGGPRQPRSAPWHHPVPRPRGRAAGARRVVQTD